LKVLYGHYQECQLLLATQLTGVPSCLVAFSILSFIPTAQRPVTPDSGPRPAITAMCRTPDGQSILFGSQAGVFLAGSDLRPQRAIATELEHVHHLAFSPDRSLLAVAGGSPAEYGAVELWSWPERRRVRLIEGHDDVVNAVEWLGDSNTLVTAGADRTICVWDAATGKLTATLKGHSGPVQCLAVSPDSKLLCSGSSDQTIRVWDVATWQLVRSLTNHLGPVHALAFRPTSPAAKEQPRSVLASAGGDGTVRLWQPEIGRMVRIIQHATAALALGWKSSVLLYCGYKDGSVRAIDETGEVQHEARLSEGWITSLVVDSSDRMFIGDSLGRIVPLSLEDKR
jgi:WD40 repeat protein